MSISQQPFLTETAIYVVEGWKKSMGYFFFRSFSAIFARPRFVDATPWKRDVTTLSLYCTWLVTGAGKRM